MFPEHLWDIVYSLEKQMEYDEIVSEQIIEKAEEYLDSIGKDIEIKKTRYAHEEINLSYSQNTSQVQEERGGLEYTMMFPDWIGTQEGVIDGIRYIYESDQYETENGSEVLIFKKIDENGVIVDQFEIEVEDQPFYLPD